MTSPATPTPRRCAYRRRLLYVDGSLQRSLLLTMVVLEVALVATSIWLAHWRLVHFIDTSMYRMHAAQEGLTLMRLAREGFPVLVLFVAVNLVLLTLAAGLWSKRENGVLQNFVELIEKTRKLDFSSDPEAPRQHEVLTLAVAWRARERARFAVLREQLTNLDAAASTGEQLQDMRTAVTRLKPLWS